MNDFTTINDIIENSIKNSSYISVLISSGVFILYTLINKVVEVFKNKDKNKPFLEMAKAIKEVSSNVVMLNSVLTKSIQDNEKKELAKTRNVVILVFDSFQVNIANKCIDTIIHNHIEENKTLIVENINKLVSTEYYKLYSVLCNYEINDIAVSTKLKEEWIKEIVDDILAIMYNQQDSISRIAQLNNKLYLDINGYSTYILNKTFN